jgi:hypothetical protein
MGDGVGPSDLPGVAVQRSRLQRRLRHLRNWEAIDVVLIPCLCAWIWLRSGSPVAWSTRLPALALVSLVLAQGAWYWHVKLDSVRRRVPLSGASCHLFRALRRGTLLGFLVAAGGTAFAHRAGSGRAVDLGWAVVLLGFAALEYVNYHHWQLMHDSRADWAYLRRYRRLRRAPLAVDLTRTCRDAARR